MGTYTLQTPVGQFVSDRPAAARIFERWGLDYCCGGKLPLGEACRRNGIEAAAVLDALVADAKAPDAVDRPAWAHAPLGELLTHILDVHHVYLRRELPRLEALADKVASVHSERHPELVEARMLMHQVAGELELHMQKEERILFPMIQELGGTVHPRAFHCGSISNPIRVMEMEHDDAGQGMARLRELTGGFVPPADACNSYRVLLDGLAALEADLHEHIHEENNILFPRAEELERSFQNANA